MMKILTDKIPIGLEKQSTKNSTFTKYKRKT